MNKVELYEKIKSVGVKQEEYDEVFVKKKTELTERYKTCGMEEPKEEDVVNFLYTYYKIRLKK